ncbi:MAG: O-antigen ligase family protein [Actinomycetes bacterium]
MLDTRSKQILGTVVLTAVTAVTLVMAPYTSADPINLPKLSALAFISIIAFSLVVPQFKKLVLSQYRVLVGLIALFLVQIILVVAFSGANLGGQFYGTFGRNTGALAYISLAFILLASAIVSGADFLKKYIHLTLVVGAVLVFYGNIQYFGLEPFPFANAYTVNAPIGTFGNPDFQSAFMGLIAVVSFTSALNKLYKPAPRIALVVMGFISLVVVYETLAKQGYFAFLAGGGVVVVLWLFMMKRKTLALSLVGIGGVGGGLVFLGLINLGPFASRLYKASLEARGYYWRAAAKMLIEHPFVGVGMDGFGDWYRRSRAEDYAANNFFSVSNTAHNVYLDIASSGGFPLITIYLAILVLVIISIVRVVKRSEDFDLYFVAVVGAWTAYQVQSFVSINQLGLAIWGWVLSGLIIGYEINTRHVESTTSTPAPSKNQRKGLKSSKSTVNALPSTTVISLFAGVLLAALVAIPPYVASSSYYSALKSGDAKRIQDAAYLKPYELMRFLQVAATLNSNKLEAQAISVVKDAAPKYPDSYDIWNLWAAIPSAAPSDIAYAKAQLKRLDPFNPDLK